jgi:CRISPR-associated protein Csx10
MHYIPGSTIRGVFAGAIPAGDLVTLENLILGDGVSFLNAYPLAGASRSFPAPISWRRTKYGDEIYDLAASSPEETLGDAPAEFAVVEMGNPIRAEVRVTSQAHHQRDREKGRATREKGAVFTYESLDPGQSFGGVIKADSSALLTELERLLPDASIVSVGRSRRAGYGGEALFTWGAVRDSESALSSVTGDIKPGTEFRILLTSPCIVRHPMTGQPDPAALHEILKSYFEVGAIEIVAVRWAFTRAVSHNRTWRLRVPEMPAVSGGSVVVARAKGDITVALRKLEDEGIGERRGEGFGRVICLPAPSQEVVFSTSTDSVVVDQPIASSPEADSLLAQMQLRILLERTDREIDLATARVIQSALRIPSRALLGRLLIPLMRNQQQSLATMTQWLTVEGRGALRRRALDQIKDCRLKIGGDPRALDEVLRSLAGSGDSDFDLETNLNLPEALQQTSLIDISRARHLLEQERPELRRTLMIRILTSLQKKSKGTEVSHVS